MTQQFACWKCGTRIDAEPAAAGLQIACPHCQSPVTVPRELFGTVPPGASPPRLHRVPAVKNPVTAAILNFFFPGGGYIYLGRMWGLAILIPIILISLGECAAGFENPDKATSAGEMLFWMGLSGALAWHAYKMAEQDRKKRDP